MAYVNTSRAASPGLVDRVSALVAAVKLSLQRRATYQQTLHELNNLSDRDLADLGLSRASIRSVAREAAYGV